MADGVVGARAGPDPDAIGGHCRTRLCVDQRQDERPAGLAIEDDAANRNLARVVVVPLSSNVERQYLSEALMSVGGQSSKAMADQVMAADRRRLKERLGALSKAD